MNQVPVPPIGPSPGLKTLPIEPFSADGSIGEIACTRPNTRLKYSNRGPKLVTMYCDPFCVAPSGASKGAAEAQVGQAVDEAPHVQAMACQNIFDCARPGRKNDLRSGVL